MSRILIADDDGSVRAMLKLQLEKKGHVILQAGDGEEAWNTLKAESPELILLDGMMPKIDGWRLCGKIKTDPETRAIPVVMLTSRQEKVAELRAHESGADAYLTKPWTGAQVLQIIDQLLNSPQNSPLDSRIP